MKSIQVDNNLAQFRIGSENRPIATRTSFCLLGHYQAGNRSAARRWLDRIKAQGFDGPRLFGENEDWFPGTLFFGTSYTPKVTAFGPNAPANSSIELVSGYKDQVRQLAEDLEERDMIAEFCCIATVKGRDPAITSQGLNKFAQMFRELYPDPATTPFLHEAINEWDTHATLDPTEVERIGARWRRSSPEPSKHNYPGSTIGVSAGGQWLPGMDDRYYTHRNLHPTRGPLWYMGANGENLVVTLERSKNAAGKRPLNLNEIVHYMTQAQWDEWTPRVPKWINLSTTDHDRVAEYVATCLANDVSVCFHDLIGMGTSPDEPVSDGERAVAEVLGGTVTNPPPPPPPPPPPSPTSIQVVTTHIDPENRSFATKLERAPEVVKGGSEAFVLRDKVTIELWRKVDSLMMTIFHGVDRGDIVEMDTEIYANGIPVVLRSDHKETAGPFQAWTYHMTYMVCEKIDISVLCRVNGANQFSGTLAARPHWGIWLVGTM